MLDFLTHLFSSAGFEPHGYGYLWQPQILWLHVGANALIAFAYFAIPLMLLSFSYKRRDLVHRPVFVMFGVFILLCGITHLMDIWTIWQGIYRIEGVVKLLTASVSVPTTVMLWRMMPAALGLPSPSQLAQANQKMSYQELEQRVAARTAELQQANERLAREVAERKRAEEELAHSNAELRRSNQELEQFASVASHDLQEPLRKVTNYAEIFAKRYRGQLDDKAEKYLAYIVDGTTRMQRLIKDLLTYSRITRESTLEPADMEAVLRQTLSTLEMALRETQAEVTWEALPTVQANTFQVEQLLQNLIGNALKFRNGAAPRIRIAATEQPTEWVFAVQDNGIGIAPQYAERIFGVFQRLHTRTEYPGTGIGLAICQKIVERHGGRIWVESTPDCGATFYFTMPHDMDGMMSEEGDSDERNS